MNNKNYEIIVDKNSTRGADLSNLFAYPDLNSDAKLVLVFLLGEFNYYYHMNDHITHSDISEMIHLSSGKTARAINQLKQKGFISISKVTNESTKKFGGYFWRISAIPGTFTSDESDEV